MSSTTDPDEPGYGSSEENILYDLTIHAEWPQEPEITVSSPSQIQISMTTAVKSLTFIAPARPGDFEIMKKSSQFRPT